MYNKTYTYIHVHIYMYVCVDFASMYMYTCMFVTHRRSFTSKLISTHTHTHTCNHSSGVSQPLQCLDRCSNQPHLVAVGRGNGSVCFWDLRQDKQPVSILQGHSSDSASFLSPFHPLSLPLTLPLNPPSQPPPPSLSLPLYPPLSTLS